MSTANLDHADLSAVDWGGLIREDVMDTIWDISAIPLPFTDMIGSGSCKQEYHEWTTDELQSPDKTNAVVDGADATGNGTNNGERLGNHCQMSDKVVRVSHRAQAADTIGYSDALAYQMMMRQRELRRDVEAILLSEQGSIADNGDAVAGRSAGLFAFIRDSTANSGNSLVGANGERPGFASGVVDGATYSTTDFAAGTTRALSEELVRDACQLAYEDGGNPSVLMTLPSLCRKFSEYLFTSSARVASLYSDVGQADAQAVAKGSVNMFATDFGISLEIVPNRIMQPEVATTGSRRVNVGILDPDYISLDFLQGYRTDPLAKTGTADNRQMTVDFCLSVLSTQAQAAICDIDDEAAVTQATA
jgi:hypothetical protein